MSDKNKRKERELKEGFIRRGGVNTKPPTSRPQKPTGQNPKPKSDND